jgi:hypothetical protein
MHLSVSVIHLRRMDIANIANDYTLDGSPTHCTHNFLSPNPFCCFFGKGLLRLK